MSHYDEKWIEKNPPMNAYEFAIREAIRLAIATIESRHATIGEIQDQIQKAEASVDALAQSINVLKDAALPDAIEAIKGKSEEISRQILQAKTRLVSTQDYLNEDQKKLSILRGVCPHEHSEYYNHDYHKNEEMRKCTLCGSIF